MYLSLEFTVKCQSRLLHSAHFITVQLDFFLLLMSDTEVIIDPPADDHDATAVDVDVKQLLQNLSSQMETLRQEVKDSKEETAESVSKKLSKEAKSYTFKKKGDKMQHL